MKQQHRMGHSTNAQRALRATRRDMTGGRAAVCVATVLWALGLISCTTQAQTQAAQAGSTPSEAVDPTVSLPIYPLSKNAPAARLETEVLVELPSGATFEAPPAWYISSSEGRVHLEDPDRELSVRLLEIEADSGLAAIEQAWQQVQPGFDRVIRHTMKPPPREGWDEIIQNVYETATAEERSIIAAARRKGDTWYVALIDGSDAALDRRGAQLYAGMTSFKAPGVEEESFAGKAANRLDQARLAAFADFVEQARQAADVPGAAVAIVQDGEVVYAQGFGTTRQGEDEPVTADTRFLIGSTTKSLTTLMMAMLVDEGVLAWDRPVIDVYPDFALADPEITPLITMKHTVCACTGLPRQDMEFLFEYEGVTPQDMVAVMKTMAPTTGFGETFQYSNPLVSTGGYVAAHAAAPDRPLGEAYDAVMRARVYEPLGMDATTCDFADAASPTYATPHGFNVRLETAPLPVAIEKVLIPVRPAGGAWSTARDMARYLQMELSGGIAPSGKRIVSRENLLRRREPQVKITDEDSYGLGLFVGQTKDVPTIGHGGNTLGFTSDMVFFPEHDIGAVVLANAGAANGFRSAVRRRLVEILFDGRPEAEENLAYSLAQREKQFGKLREEIDFDPQQSWLQSLAGTYAEPSLGRLELRLPSTSSRTGERTAGGGFTSAPAVVDVGEWQSGVAQRTGPDGVKKLILLDPPFAGLELIPGEAHGQRTLELDLAQQRYVFEQAP